MCEIEKWDGDILETEVFCFLVAFWPSSPKYLKIYIFVSHGMEQVKYITSEICKFAALNLFTGKSHSKIKCK